MAKEVYTIEITRVSAPEGGGVVVPGDVKYGLTVDVENFEITTDMSLGVILRRGIKMLEEKLNG